MPIKVFMPEGFDYKLTYYVSGPMQGYLENNFPAFARITEALREAGILCLSPHEIEHGDYIAWQAFLRRDIYEMTRKCQGIILIKGWPQSQGAGLESNIAIRLNYPTYYFHEHADNLTAKLVDMNRDLS